MKGLKIFFLLAFTIASFLTFAKDKPREWKTGTLFDTTSEKGKRLVGSGGSIHERRDDATYYAIESGDIIYTLKRTLTSRHDKQLRVTINGPVKFAIEKDDFYLLDEDGKEHKLSLESKRLKEKSSSSN